MKIKKKDFYFKHPLIYDMGVLYQGATLLGIKFNEQQNWKNHIFGKGGIILSLNQRLFTIRRLKNHVNNEALIRIRDSLFNSKIRYGVQLLGKVRMSDQETISGEFKAIQKTQNKLIRLLNGVKLSDKKSTKSLFGNIGMLSIIIHNCNMIH